MNIRLVITGLLIVLIAFLIHLAVRAAGGPDYVTILYTSDELGYLNPCG